MRRINDLISSVEEIKRIENVYEYNRSSNVELDKYDNSTAFS